MAASFVAEETRQLRLARPALPFTCWARRGEQRATAYAFYFAVFFAAAFFGAAFFAAAFFGAVFFVATFFVAVFFVLFFAAMMCTLVAMRGDAGHPATAEPEQ